MTPTLAYDPDEMILSKEDIEQRLKNIQKRWGKNKKDNFALMTSMYGLQAYIAIHDESEIVAIWKEILKELNDCIVENGLKRARLNNAQNPDEDKFIQTYDKITKAKEELDRQTEKELAESSKGILSKIGDRLKNA